MQIIDKIYYFLMFVIDIGMPTQNSSFHSISTMTASQKQEPAPGRVEINYKVLLR